MTAVHIAVELERMGDHAAGIASLVERMQSDREIASFWKLPKMAKRARKMLGEGIEAYLQHDADLAENMMQRDDKLDKHYFLLFRSIIEEMEHTDDYIRLGTFLLWIGHNLERIGDRATNIAEQIIFMKTGKYPEIVLQP